MNQIEHAILRARIEYRKNGVLSTTTVMALANLGIDVPTLEHTFDNEENA